MQVLNSGGAETSRDTPEEIALLREVAAKSIVLLKNSNNVLPLDANSFKASGKKLAIIGPNAKDRIIFGGGSAALKTSWIVTPYDGIVKALPEGTEVVYVEGARCTSVILLGEKC